MDPRVRAGDTGGGRESVFAVSRRQLLWGGLGGAAVITAQSVNVQSNAQAADRAMGISGGDRAAIKVTQSLTAVVFSSDGRTRSEVDFPALIELGGFAASRIDLVWDQRIWSVSTSAIIQDRLGGVHVIVAASASANAMSYELPADAVLLVPQVKNVATYPQDLVDDILPAQWTYNEETVVSQTRTAQASAWGAELAVAWTLLERQYIPSIVQIRSIGPSAIPEGVQIEYLLTLDGAALISESPVGSSESTQGKGASERHRVLVDVVDSVAPGDIREMTLSIPTVEKETRPNLSQTPTVSLIMPDGARSDCRSTGAYASAPVSDSGTALSNFEKVETA